MPACAMCQVPVMKHLFPLVCDAKQFVGFETQGASFCVGALAQVFQWHGPRASP